MADFIEFAGPIGGILAITWGSGAVSGYAFAGKTLGKQIGDLKEEAKSLRAEMVDDKRRCDERIDELMNRVREVEDRYTNGMERQLAQSRQSSAYILDRGQIIKQGDDK